jgi:hypothetical protein
LAKGSLTSRLFIEKKVSPLNNKGAAYLIIVTFFCHAAVVEVQGHDWENRVSPLERRLPYGQCATFPFHKLIIIIFFLLGRGWKFMQMKAIFKY